jgi:hypothetical protein
MEYINLNDDLQAETEHKPTDWREEESERESLLRMDTSTETGHTEEGLVTGDGEILKNKSDSVKFQKDATILKFPTGNQLEGDSTIISTSDAKTYPILQLSEENNHKLLLLAATLENVDTIKKMLGCKLQICFFDSAKQLKLKEFKYNANPSVRQHLFQLFFNQLLSILSSVESFEDVLLEDYKVHPFEDPNRAPNKALFCLLLT